MQVVQSLKIGPKAFVKFIAAAFTALQQQYIMKASLKFTMVPLMVALVPRAISKFGDILFKVIGMINLQKNPNFIFMMAL